MSFTHGFIRYQNNFRKFCDISAVLIVVFFFKTTMSHIIVADSNNIVNHRIWHGKPRLIRAFSKTKTIEKFEFMMVWMFPNLVEIILEKNVKIDLLPN